jgi:hypothetical protein
MVLTLTVSDGKNLYQQCAMLEFYYQKVILNYNNLHYMNLTTV